MKVKFEGNTLTINTGVPVSILEHGCVKLKDDKGNDVYTVAKIESTENILVSLGKRLFPVNSVDAEGNAQLVAVVKMGVSLDTIKHEIGDDLIAAAEYLPSLVADVRAKEAQLDEMFEEPVTTAE